MQQEPLLTIALVGSAGLFISSCGDARALSKPEFLGTFPGDFDAALQETVVLERDYGLIVCGAEDT